MGWPPCLLCWFWVVGCWSWPWTLNRLHSSLAAPSAHCDFPAWLALLVVLLLILFSCYHWNREKDGWKSEISQRPSGLERKCKWRKCRAFLALHAYFKMLGWSCEITWNQRISHLPGFRLQVKFEHIFSVKPDLGRTNIPGHRGTSEQQTWLWEPWGLLLLKSSKMAKYSSWRRRSTGFEALFDDLQAPAAREKHEGAADIKQETRGRPVEGTSAPETQQTDQQRCHFQPLSLSLSDYLSLLLFLSFNNLRAD